MREYVELRSSLIFSPAFASLSKASTHVYLRFYIQRYNQRLKKNLTFTYKEARTEIGLSNQAFIDAIDELIEKGFIVRIQRPNGNSYRTIQYELSGMWRKWGTPRFETIEPRIKDPKRKGRIENLRFIRS